MAVARAVRHISGHGFRMPDTRSAQNAGRPIGHASVGRACNHGRMPIIPVAVLLAGLGARGRWPPVTRCPATSTSTWPSPAPGSPGCGRRTTWPAPSPALRIAVCEREIAGFGASGRNGGWCSALFPASLAKLARMAGRDAAIAMYRAMQRTVDEVGRVAAAEGIDCHWAKGGTVQLARSAGPAGAGPRRGRRGPGVRVRRGRPAAADRGRGRGARSRRPTCSARPTPRTARRSTPARLVRGPGRGGRGAAAVACTRTRRSPRSRRGGCAPRAAPSGPRYVIRATEGYTPELPGLRPGDRAGVLADGRHRAAAGGGVGADRAGQRPTFGDYRHLIIYGQRTADGRLAFGGRGAPYHFGSAIRPDSTGPARCSRALRRTLRRAVPGPRRRRRSRTPGAARSACPGTGARRSGWTRPPASAGPAATSATAWPPPTWPGGPWPT